MPGPPPVPPGTVKNAFVTSVTAQFAALSPPITPAQYQAAVGQALEDAFNAGFQAAFPLAIALVALLNPLGLTTATGGPVTGTTAAGSIG